MPLIDFENNWPYLFSGILGVLAASLITWLFYIRDQHQRNLELIASCFPNIINFSYNFMEDSTLKFRTLFETTIDEISQSPELERIMQLAADNCTEEDAFFTAPEEEEQNKKTWVGRLGQKIWPKLNWQQASEHLHLGILNALSAWYSDGHFGHALLGITDPHTGKQKHQNISIVTETFCFGLTCEKNSDVRARKIRVMIAAKDFLKHQVDETAPRPRFERPGHWVRWETMCQMKRHMERQESAAAKNERMIRKVWELSLSFIVPKMSTQDVEQELQMTSQMETLKEQIADLQEQIQKSGSGLRLRQSNGPRGSTESGPGCTWREGAEADTAMEVTDDAQHSNSVRVDDAQPPVGDGKRNLEQQDLGYCSREYDPADAAQFRQETDSGSKKRFSNSMTMDKQLSSRSGGSKTGGSRDGKFRILAGLL